MTVLEVFSLGPFETNAILLGCSETREAVLIDAPQGCFKVAVKDAQKEDLRIEKLLLTHSHQDHIAEASLVKERLKIPLYVHREDADNLINPGSDGLPLMIQVEGVSPDHYLTEGEIVKVGNLELMVLHTPGHTPGSCCFYLAKEGILFSGDTLFKGAIGNLSFPTSRPSLMWPSLKRLADLPAETRVFPGHGEETTIGEEQWIKHAKERYGG